MTYTKIQGILTTLVLVIDVVWIGSSSFLLHYNGLELIVFAGLFLLFWMLYFSYQKRDLQPKSITALQSTLLLLLYTKFTLVLSYLAYTTNYPLVNSTLASLDNSLGFNVEKLFFWFQANPWWNKVFTLIYDTSKPQILLIIVYFSFFGNPVYLQRFIMLFMLSIPLTIFIGSLFPAVGTYAWYHYAADDTQLKVLQHFYELRNNILGADT